jgi:uncharacterized repeat protein (TIGR03803 family)
MHTPIRSFQRFPPALALAVMFFCAIRAGAGTEKILHEFSFQQRGADPYAMVTDSSGNIFGTAQFGGNLNWGVVYELTPKASGGWTQTVLHSFSGISDGGNPHELILDPAGNLYGTTQYGGPGTCTYYGCGVVYKLTPNSKGGWDYRVLYSLQASDGFAADAIIRDGSGNLYSAAASSANTCSVFKLSPSGETWTQTVLYTLSDCTGTIPGLTLDDAGNLYGTVTSTKAAPYGIIFELSPSSGSWTETTLYTFLGTANGGTPNGRLLFHNGNLYGATNKGGSSNCLCGVVFELQPGSNGQWSQNVLFFIRGAVDQTTSPELAAFDSHGNLIGSIFAGGGGSCVYCGSVFALTPKSGDRWVETDLWDFDGQSDGDYPSRVALGPAGQIYGATTGPTSFSSVFGGAVFELTAASSPSGVWNFNQLYPFPFTDGQWPYAGLVADAAGNLYGATAYGGVNNVGSVFRVSPTANGWKESLIYSFGPASNTAFFSASPSGLVFDPQGNLIGTAELGGANQTGSVFELVPRADGGWNERDIYGFRAGAPVEPIGNVVFDKAGRIYGVTQYGGAHNFGMIFQLTRASGGQWTHKVLHSFSGYPTDGANPLAGLTIDSSGNIYGVTYRGGSGQCVRKSGTYLGCGAVFELSYVAGTGWTETVLHSFLGEKANDGAAPQASLILDQSGNLYGTTFGGGIVGARCSGLAPPGCGTVFELSPSSGGWRETILFEFLGFSADGSGPAGPLLLDPAGNLYGTTGGGGSYNYGTLFKLTPGAAGWTESVIYNFGSIGDGEYPGSFLLLDAAGNIYGTTSAGGPGGGVDNNGQGTVFEITP